MRRVYVDLATSALHDLSRHSQYLTRERIFTRSGLGCLSFFTSYLIAVVFCCLFFLFPFINGARGIWIRNWNHLPFVIFIFSTLLFHDYVTSQSSSSSPLHPINCIALLYHIPQSATDGWFNTPYFTSTATHSTPFPPPSKGSSSIILLTLFFSGNTVTTFYPRFFSIHWIALYLASLPLFQSYPPFPAQASDQQHLLLKRYSDYHFLITLHSRSSSSLCDLTRLLSNCILLLQS